MSVSVTASTIAARETATYSELWSFPQYADESPGLRYLSLLQGYAPLGASVLDVGSGSGRASLALDELGYRVSMVDLTDEGLVPEARRLPFLPACAWRGIPPGPRAYDWAYCVDVLEHLPTQFTMLSIHHILNVCVQGALFGVALAPDQMGAWVGRPLHLTVQPFVWWRDSLAELGDVVDARDLIQNAVFVVRRRDA